MKSYTLLLFLATAAFLNGCPLTIMNDDPQKHDLIIADEKKAIIVRYGKTGTIGKVGVPTTFFIYTARTTNDTELFNATVAVKEKRCPTPTTCKKGKKKKETLKLCQLQARSKTDPVTQTNDSERFVVEAIAKK